MGWCQLVWSSHGGHADPGGCTARHWLVAFGIAIHVSLREAVMDKKNNVLLQCFVIVKFMDRSRPRKSSFPLGVQEGTRLS